jgi:CheY-like chemotaxis protein
VDAPSNFTGVKVLLVEDNQVNQLVAAAMLNKLNCIVETANSGLDAIEMVTKRVFDIIYMDCQMPEMDGYEATKNIKRKMKNGDIPNIPIVALTAHAMQADKEKCLAVGMDDYIAKPVREADFAKTLNYWVKNSPLNNGDKLLEGNSLQKLQDLMGSAFPDLVRMYIANTESSIRKMEEGLLAEDSHVISQNAHTIKSPSSQMGAKKIASIASDMEKAAKEGNMAYCGELLVQLKNYYVEAREELKEFI